MSSADQSNETAVRESRQCSSSSAASPAAPTYAFNQQVGSIAAATRKVKRGETSSSESCQSSEVAVNDCGPIADSETPGPANEEALLTQPLKTGHSMPRNHPQSPSSKPTSPVNGERISASRGDVNVNGDNNQSSEAGTVEDTSWRNFCYEHPLHAATSAMLNLGEGAEESAPGSAVNFHEQYLQSKFQAHNPGAYSVVHYTHKDAKSSNDLWPAQHLNGDAATGHHKDYHNSQMLQTGQEVFPVVVKKEPEDLTRRGGRDVGQEKPGEVSRFEPVHDVIPRLETIPHGSTSGSVIHLRRPQPPHQGEPDPSVNPALDLVRAPQYSSGSYNSAGHNISAIHSINHTYLSPSGYGFLASSNESPLFATSSTTMRNPFPANLNQGSDPFYRDYLPSNSNGIGEQFARAPAAQPTPYQAEMHENNSFVERFIRNHGAYKSHHLTAGTNLSVDLPSPDSGIGVDAGTPREQSVVQQGFDYTELCQPNMSNMEATIQENHAIDLQESQAPQTGDLRRLDDSSRSVASVDSKGSMSPGNNRSRSWHDCNRQNEVDKVQIPKLLNQYGFRYFLESPISTSQRREDDRITYVNKGQFYGITLEYVPDPERPLKNQTVKSMIMVVFREEKTPEDEAKAWHFWHSRQHSAKQRILDADTKNSTGLVGCIEEVSHNAICIYWNPLESPAKINVAIQCLSTDFSSQKGVKGLPLHVQIDTFDDPRDAIPVFHRGYCQVKVFCDKGAERKTRDEERRAAKRKLVVTGRNKRLDELYHPSCERSEFYHMADLLKPPTLFTPVDHEKVGPGMEMQSFYPHDVERKEYVDPCATGSVPLASLTPVANPVYSSSVISKRMKVTPPAYERVMIYVRQENELVFTPLHLVPPTIVGLMDAIESKYKISAANISSIYRRNLKGILAKVDDEMLKHYCNEDLFILEITTSTTEGMYDITLKDICDA